MNDEKFVEKKVREARFHLRKKLEDVGGLPSIQIPYNKREFEKINELFGSIKNLAEANHLKVEVVDDGTRHIRWSYKFEPPLVVSSYE